MEILLYETLSLMMVTSEVAERVETKQCPLWGSEPTSDSKEELGEAKKERLVRVLAQNRHENTNPAV